MTTRAKRKFIKQYCNKYPEERICNVDKLKGYEIKVLYPVMMAKSTIRERCNINDYSGLDISVSEKGEVGACYHENYTTPIQYVALEIDSDTRNKILFLSDEIGREYALTGDMLVGRCNANRTPIGKVTEIQRDDAANRYIATIKLRPEFIKLRKE